MKGAQIFVECLKREGVKVIFGYPGGAVLPLCDVLYDSGIRFILTRHEQGAAHAADGFSRSSGKVGVCLATSGPGATNLVTGIATAYMDSVPIVAITGQVATHLIGNDAFQEVDTTGITRPITKHNYLIKDVNEIPRVVREAFYIARTGRPGPVLIDFPVDIQRKEGEFYWPEKVEIRSYKPKYEGHPLQIKKAWDLIKSSKKPVLIAGGGVIISNASEELKKFLEKTNIPVTFTLLGLGSIDVEWEYSLGMPGMHGTKYANFAISEADLLISVGCRFDDRVTGKIDEFAPNAKIIHIDIDPSAISKNVEVDVPIVGDAKLVLKKLNEIAEKIDIDEWLKKIKEWKEKFPLKYERNGFKPQYIIEKISEYTKGDAIICTEVGQNQMWTAQYYKFKKPRTLITSGGLGTMGYGFPAAIGAKVANPEKIVIDIAGDGSIQMNIQELATAVYNKIPVKVFILNNCYLGMVRQWQQLFYNRRYAFTCLEGGQPDFVKLAESYGAIGYRVTNEQEFDNILPKVLEEKEKVVFVDCRIEPEENVFPMVPAGASLTEILDGLA
ncbi:MAG: biosynthetic-type acetolactate synthase large subunit [Candidatus Omnitrophica bacterium]|nr:biosynthetic-type acetolactate synthase large subunit [Candidatus Omnitrophota bacterium]MCM8809599.1 biosynthetic-type acetolactate synthase large subunit [Candidatus Omnitrophota bacterium]MCM8833570.1 biosynthetic-type acetolactate synthase large subunit [Candidatus Omnitrophota bacterium]